MSRAFNHNYSTIVTVFIVYRAVGTESQVKAIPINAIKHSNESFYTFISFKNVIKFTQQLRILYVCFRRAHMVLFSIKVPSGAVACDKRNTIKYAFELHFGIENDKISNGIK